MGSMPQAKFLLAYPNASTRAPWIRSHGFACKCFLNHVREASSSATPWEGPSELPATRQERYHLQGPLSPDVSALGASITLALAVSITSLSLSLHGARDALVRLLM